MCQYQKYSKGFKCRGDDWPAMMQGQYLPGDEPGFYCDELDDHCCMEDCPYGEDYWQSECGDPNDCYPEDPIAERECARYVERREEGCYV